MTSLVAASLTSSLLVPKGRATALGFAPVAPTQPSLRAPLGGGASEPIPFACHGEDRADPSPARNGTPVAQGRTGASGGVRGSGAPTRAKLSLRLDSERHLRLRLLSAHLRKSSQELLIEALDSYLAGISPPLGAGLSCACLASGKPAKADCRGTTDRSGRRPGRDL